MDKYFKNRIDEFAQDWVAYCEVCYKDIQKDMDAEDVPSFEMFMKDFTGDVLKEYIDDEMEEFVNSVKAKVIKKDVLITTIQATNQTMKIKMDYKFK